MLGNKYIKIFLSLMMMGVACTSTTTTGDNTYKSTPLVSKVEYVEVIAELADRPVASLSNVEQKIRNAAVKVRTPNGHGSGTYMIFEGFHVVFTAAHVVVDDTSLGQPTSPLLIEGNDETVAAKTIYIDDRQDVAVLLLESKMISRKPIKHRGMKNVSRIGTRLTYSGYPSSHNLLTMRGVVAGYGISDGKTVVLMHSFGWFGCSGSGVFDESGNFVGVLWGIEVDFVMGMPQIIEDILWITPSSQIDYESIKKNLCLDSNKKTFKCKKYKE